MTGGRRVVSFMRQRDWPGALFELVIVALGVLLAIQANNWNESRDQRRRTAQVVAVLRQDLQDSTTFEEKAGPEVDAGLAAFEAARRRGEQPIPYYYRIPGSDTPPNTAWESALQTGLADLIDPALLFDLGFFYSEQQGIGLRYSHYARFVEDQVLPWANDPAHFYDAGGALKPEYAANMERLRDWRNFVTVMISTAHCLDARFARPAEPGPSCRPTYGPSFERVPEVRSEARYTAFSALSKSAIRSSAFSTPIEIRTRLSVIPIAALRSSGTDRCVIAAGALASVSVPPRLTASLAIFKASRKANASRSPPFR